MQSSFLQDRVISLMFSATVRLFHSLSWPQLCITTFPPQVKLSLPYGMFIAYSLPPTVKHKWNRNEVCVIIFSLLSACRKASLLLFVRTKKIRTMNKRWRCNVNLLPTTFIKYFFLSFVSPFLFLSMHLLFVLPSIQSSFTSVTSF